MSRLKSITVALRIRSSFGAVRVSSIVGEIAVEAKAVRVNSGRPSASVDQSAATIGWSATVGTLSPPAMLRGQRRVSNSDLV